MHIPPQSGNLQPARSRSCKYGCSIPHDQEPARYPQRRRYPLGCSAPASLLSKPCVRWWWSLTLLAAAFDDAQDGSLNLSTLYSSAQLHFIAVVLSICKGLLCITGCCANRRVRSQHLGNPAMARRLIWPVVQ